MNDFRPLDEYHEDMGAVLWTRMPIEEPPWSGTPEDSDWPYDNQDFEMFFMPLPAAFNGEITMNDPNYKEILRDEIATAIAPVFWQEMCLGFRADDTRDCPTFPEACRDAYRFADYMLSEREATDFTRALDAGIVEECDHSQTDVSGTGHEP